MCVCVHITIGYVFMLLVDNNGRKKMKTQPRPPLYPPSSTYEKHFQLERYYCT